MLLYSGLAQHQQRQRPVKYRNLEATDLELSEVGFGVWSVSTTWWGGMEPDGAVRLLQQAADLGITFFDTSDVYGDGYGEEILPRALAARRNELVYGTKFGYDLEAPRQPGQHTERPQNWSPDFVRSACESSLRRLQTDYIDLYQLHNPRLKTIESDELFEVLDALVSEGKIRHYAVAVGPDIGWREEGEFTIASRKAPAQIIYSILEQDPANDFIDLAAEHRVGLFSRVPHASGMLDGTYAKDTNLEEFPFDPSDHRAYRKMEWLKKSITKLGMLDFLLRDKAATVGQIAIKFCLTPEPIASVLPTITTPQELEEYAAAPEIDPLPADELERLAELYADNFGLGEKDPLKSSVAS